jgi:hypothetical protein
MGMFRIEARFLHHPGVKSTQAMPWNVAMPAEQKPHLPMIERIERALVLLAYFIELDGDVHVPMYEKFEAELKELRQREDTRARARRLLMSYSDAGGLKAIC